jgi:uncharacterized membrane protein
MYLGMMLLRIYALYERRLGILILPVIIAISSTTVGAVSAKYLHHHLTIIT